MMKNRKLRNLKSTLLLGLIFVLVLGCERDGNEDVTLATFPNTADIYTDDPVGLTDQFFRSFDPATGASTEAFGTDRNEAFEGSSSIRIDVPAPNDPDGSYVGGIFEDRGAGRDLSGYNALTFWAKASRTATLDEAGFGNDFGENKYVVTRSNIQLATDWRKVIIPIPDPSKLTQEKGLFIFSTGTSSTNGEGFTFWMDEMRFENLGTIGQERPALFGGLDQTVQANVDTSIPIGSLTFTVNQANGQDVTVNAAPAYFNFKTSNPFVASVDALGVVTVEGFGEGDNNTSVITADVGGIEAEGSLTVEPSNINILPIFSNVFGNVSGFNPAAFNNQDIIIEGQANGTDEAILYGNLGFVGIGWDVTVDASELTHVHVDVQLQSPGSSLIVELSSPSDSGGFDATSQLVQGEWVGIDIPLNAFTLPTGGGGGGSPDLSNLNFFILVSNGGTFLIDNIYFYAEN